MKYIFPFLLILIGKSNALFAQSFSNSPGDTIDVHVPFGVPLVLDINQTNNSQDTIEFVWKKITENLPSGWDALICDNRMCYFNLMDSGTTMPVVPNDVGWMSLHCNPQISSGIGIVQYTIYDPHFPQQIDTLTWIINTVTTDVNTIPTDLSQIIFRDGKINYEFKKDEFNELSIVNMDGKILYRKSIRENGQIEFPALPKSVYIVRLSGTKNLFTQKILN